VDSHNTSKHTKADAALARRRDNGARVVDANLVGEPELTVADDIDVGGDPYNSTGRHVIIKSKLNLED
jgi:hypothetical protein